ncbi:unnamed protein product [Plutella xylostella]|uniref:(diamondback moth) hypothetical protein n=1 Tax=Plutella xylostella TaxID=51655 RepID=A0A8S4E430_PLUXY|nr:unnamed protein product [Plutella xylostella]
MSYPKEVGGHKLGKLIIEGKTKQVFDLPENPGLCLLLNKDRITAGDGVKAHDLEGKAAISNQTNAKVFEILQATGLKTSFVKQVSPTAFLSRKCEMIPIEWVTRRLATGSFLKRNPGVPEGFRFCPPKQETFFKDDANHDPQWSEEQIVCAKFKFNGLVIDDLALTSQHTSFEEVEADLTVALNNLSAYYKENSLKPNPSKTESCAFHLRNNQAGRKLDITWQGVPIAHNSLPKYLGITLDRSLTYRKNCENVKKKVHSRNNILQRLTTTKWGASPQVLRTSGLALAFSVGEYACPVWGRSAHAKLVDTALNETCRIITGCLKPTPVQMLYPLAGIAPPDVRRTVASSAERAKMDDTRHPMHGFVLAPQRLPSRRSFMKCVDPLNTSQAQARCALWRQKVSLPTPFVQPSENLPPGHKLPWETWKSLNRLRTQVGRSKDNMARWGFTDAQNLNCLCEAPQTMVHLTSCPACPYTCTREELMTATSGAVSVAQFWACQDEVDYMRKATILVFEILEKAWALRDCALIDMKIEFGVDTEGNIVLADVIDSDSWRLWPSGDKRLMVDKQVYRNLSTVTAADLETVKRNFNWVKEQLDHLKPTIHHKVVVFMGSPADQEHCQKIAKSARDLGLDVDLRVTSAHKATEETLRIMQQYEDTHGALVFIAVAGRSNGLGPVLSGNTSYPVINCPPPSDKMVQDIWSSLSVPSGLGCATVIYPDSAALMAAQIIGLQDYLVWARLRVKQLEMATSLRHADQKLRNLSV